MMDSPIEILQLVASGVIGYLLGALPFAQWVSRYVKGVDIFSTGSTLHGRVEGLCGLSHGRWALMPRLPWLPRPHASWATGHRCFRLFAGATQ